MYRITWLRRAFRRVPTLPVILIALALVPAAGQAAPYAAMVMDARTGEVLHSRNADTRLHPASLTKMMTLYVVFEAVEHGELSLDQKITISANAAAEPPSKLGLRRGQKIALRYLIRAAAVKSANDAATALAEAVAGSEAAFARRMNRTAKALGMTRTTFKNAHGLTETGHMSTARDMTILGRHLFFDYPDYYNLFSRKSTHAGMREVANTNRRFLGAYRGADGIKTGYTRAAGFNLVASAERGSTRILATMFGGKSTAQRNARVAELLDMGFSRAPRMARVNKPAKPAYQGAGGGVGQEYRAVRAVTRSLRPVARPQRAAPAPVLVAGLQEDIEALIVEVAAPEGAAAVSSRTAGSLAGPMLGTQSTADAPVAAAPESPGWTGPRPLTRPADIVAAAAPAQTPVEPTPTVATSQPAVARAATPPLPKPAALAAPTGEVVTRVSTSGGQHWGISVGRYGSRHQAERILLQTALAEMSTLDGSLRKVVKSPRGFDATFVGMSRETADLACRRLKARNMACDTIGPG
ncbi:serine hydrolase [Poseidonocella sedimentorum]|uniref:D-alanyl-D-alanine carboxypeptidase n=1 Tax=Poseidonocella sedimentorum TaxID=871652 RepID=A0A1I6DU32_9RHOB|nr:serine hydrolase [Poseidonocella sedimentorum]SFR08994.1 D-alanyl-D-alanine carboxypeptidase [Poseidonocella sedimentorum]